MGLEAGKGAHCRTDVGHLRHELSVEGLDAVLDRLVELLESLVDLLPVIVGFLFTFLNKLVEMADAAVFISLARLVNAVTFKALLLAFGTLVFQMLHQVLAWYFDELTSIAWDEFLGTLLKVVFEVTSPQRWTGTLVWTGDHPLGALIGDVTFVLAKVDVITLALVYTLEGGPLEHLIDHRVELVERVELCLAVAALFRNVCLDAETADDFVATDTVSGIHRYVITIGTGCTREHCIGARVQLPHLRLHLSH